MAKIVRQDIDSLHGVLTVTIEQSDYTAKVDKELNLYRREAHMRGFRKGKAPDSLVRKMYGRNITAKAVTDILQFEVQEYLSSQNLDLLGQPLPQEDQEQFDFDPNDRIDYTFNFDLGYSPDFDVKGISANDTFEEYVVEVPESTIDADINQLRTKNSQPTHPDTAGSDNDVLNLEVVELENGEIAEEGIRHTFSAFWRELTEESKAAFGKLKIEDILDWDPFALLADRDESFIKRYVLDIPVGEESPRGKSFRFRVIQISRFEPAPLDQEFFDKAFGEGRVSTEAEARQLIREDIQKMYSQDAGNLLFLDFQKKLLALNEMPMPEDFLKRWVKATIEDPSDERIDADFPNLLKSLRWSLIKNKLTDQFEIQVSEEEIDAKIREAYLSMFGNSPYITGDILDNLVKRGKENEKEVTRIIDNIVLDKLFENIRNQVKIVPKHISAEEFTAINEAAYAQVEAERKAAKALDMLEEDEDE